MSCAGWEALFHIFLQKKKISRFPGFIYRFEQKNITFVSNPQRQPPEVFYETRCYWKFHKFTGKHLCQSLFFNKVAGLRPATLLKERNCHRCFPVNFAKFLRTPFLQNTFGRLLLNPELFLEDKILLFQYLLMISFCSFKVSSFFTILY